MPDQMPEDQQQPPTGRDRLRGALLRPTRGQGIVAVLLGVLGFAAVTQVRFTVPYSLKQYDGWVVAPYDSKTRKPGRVLLTT